MRMARRIRWQYRTDRRRPHAGRGRPSFPLERFSSLPARKFCR